jgi:hypothetical protein
MLAAETGKRRFVIEIRSNNIERIWHGERPTAIRTLILLLQNTPPLPPTTMIGLEPQ